MKGILILIAALGLAVPASSEQSKKKSVEVNCSTGNDDMTGAALCSALRDAVAASPRFELWDGTHSQPLLRIHVISMATQFGISVQSVTTTFDGDSTYLGHAVYIEGSNAVKTQAGSILAGSDQQLEDWKNGKRPGN